jgi:tetratricopeptide (TPR) repeat protein
MKSNSSRYPHRARLYTGLVQTELAIQDYDKAVEVDPDSYYVYSSRAGLYWDRKEYDFALQDYNKTVELAPNNIYLYTGRARLHGELGNMIWLYKTTTRL